MPGLDGFVEGFCFFGGFFVGVSPQVEASAFGRDLGWREGCFHSIVWGTYLSAVGKERLVTDLFMHTGLLTFLGGVA